MARDLNRLFDDIRRSRDVFVTQDGRIEDSREARENENAERRDSGASRPRVSLKPEAFAADVEAPLSVSLDALTAIHAEAALHTGETGGIVVGPKARCITEFIPSGRAAKRTRSSYVLDPSHLQPLLNKAQDRGLVFLGIWHSHPEGVPTLSATDRGTAERMLGDKDYGLDEVVLPLSVRAVGGFETRFFVIQRGRDAVIEPKVVVVSGEQKAQPSASAEVESVPWAFIATPAGARRLRTEQDELTRRGFATRVRATKIGMAFLVTKGPLDIAFLFPPEYPVAPPLVEARLANDPIPIPIASRRALRTWTSRSTLIEIARGIERATQDEPPPRTPGVLTRLGAALGFASLKGAA